MLDIRVPQPVHGDQRDVGLAAMSGEKSIYSRIINFIFHKNGFFFGQRLDEFCELDDGLPV